MNIGSTDGLNIGSTDGGPDSDASAGPVWNGTIDSFQLQDGSNRLTMTLWLASDGRATGNLLLGDGALLQPATDPDTGYPPGAVFPDPAGPLGFFEGFRYPMADGSSIGSSVTFRVVEFDLWAQWCSLQTKTYPQPPAFMATDGGTLYGCEPYASLGGGSGGTSTGCYYNPAVVIGALVDTTANGIPVDCGKFELCTGSSPCDCSATGCSEKVTRNQLYLDFDLVISGSHADGTISGALGEHAVHFVRAR